MRGESSNVTQFPAQVWQENRMLWHRSFGGFRDKEHLPCLCIQNYWSQNMRVCASIVEAPSGVVSTQPFYC